MVGHLRPIPMLPTLTAIVTADLGMAVRSMATVMARAVIMVAMAVKQATMVPAAIVVEQMTIRHMIAGH